MPIDFDSLGEVDGPDAVEVRDYRIVTPEEVAEDDSLTEDDVHPAASTLLEFAKDCAAKQSTDSAERYYRGVKPLVAWLDIQRDVQNPIDAARSEAKDYLRWLANSAYSRNSRKSRFTAAQKFYLWAKNDGPHDEYLVEGESIDEYTLAPGDLEDSRRETGEDDDYKWVRREKIQQLWHPDNIPSPRSRNELLFKLLWYTTCRTRAIADAKLDDLDRDEGRLRVKNLKKGKSQDDYRWVYYPKDRIEPLLQGWIDSGRRNSLGPYGPESEYIFLTHQSEKMRPSHISRKVKEAAFNAGIQEVTGYDVHGKPRWLVTGHCVRHSAATWYANECQSVELHFLKKQMGHSKFDTTLQYVHDEDQPRKRAFQQAWGTD